METTKKGSKGAAVKTLQTALGITADGIFGANTETAVKNFQREKGLTIDGIVGAKTWAALLGGNSEKPNLSDIEIVDAHINVHIKRYTGRPIKYIAIHYTAGSSSKAGSAKAVRNVFLKREASADFVVDDATIVRINPDVKNYYCWSVGDAKNIYSGGGRLFGKAKNTNTISIEICSNLQKGADHSKANHAGWTFTAASLNNARRLVRYLMKKYNVPKSNVVRHYDITGKVCPGIIGWNDADAYTMDGKKNGAKSTSVQWQAFWNSL